MVKYPVWNVEKERKEVCQELVNSGYSHLVSSVLASRNMETRAEAEEFLSFDRQMLHDPFLMKDMDRAVDCIRAAVDRGEKIAVYGDYDVDGITATCLLTDYFQKRNVDCQWFIPRRVEDGYGLNKDSLFQLKEQGVSLVITVDCGITGTEEVDYANEIGLKMVITDHHECKEPLPKACAVVNPHRPDCTYPFPNLAGVGVALKLIMALSPREERDDVLDEYVPLAAIGTVADVMVMLDENRAIVSLGLNALKKRRWIGVQALLQECGLDERTVSSVQIGFSLAPRINAAGRMGKAEIAAELFLTKDIAQAEIQAKALCELNRQRQTIEQEIFAEAERELGTYPEEERKAIVLSSKTWHQGVVGIVASRLSEKYACPCFMIHLVNGMGKGSCRSFGGINLFTALESCSDTLESFGGHELAAGFTIREENIERFRKEINEYVQNYVAEKPLENILKIDVLISQIQWITMHEVDSLSILEPYGTGNAEPVFCFYGAIIESMQNIGQNHHMKLRISKGGIMFDCIFFSVTTDTCPAEIGDRIDIAFHLHVNDFHGNRNVQLQVMDLRPSEYPGVREEECEALYHHFMDKEIITGHEAYRMLPSRQQFERLWRTMKELAVNGQISDPKYPLLRELSYGIGGNEPFLRTFICLAVFNRVGLIRTRVDEKNWLTITLQENGQKANLEETSIMKALNRVSAIEEGEHDDLSGTI